MKFYTFNQCGMIVTLHHEYNQIIQRSYCLAKGNATC